MSNMYEVELSEEEQQVQDMQDQIRFELEYSEFLYESEKRNLEIARQKYASFVDGLEAHERNKLVRFLREYRKPSMLKRLMMLMKKANKKQLI